MDIIRGMDKKLEENRDYSEEDFDKIVKEMRLLDGETRKFPNGMVATRYVGKELSLYEFIDDKVHRIQIVNNDGNICLKRETSIKPMDCKN